MGWNSGYVKFVYASHWHASSLCFPLCLFVIIINIVCFIIAFCLQRQSQNSMWMPTRQVQNILTMSGKCFALLSRWSFIQTLLAYLCLLVLHKRHTKTKGSCFYSNHPSIHPCRNHDIHDIIHVHQSGLMCFTRLHQDDTNAELHIFSSVPLRLLHTVPLVWLIQSSGLTLAWLSNKQAYRSSGQDSPPQRRKACEHILTEHSKSPHINSADTVSGGGF